MPLNHDRFSQAMMLLANAFGNYLKANPPGRNVTEEEAFQFLVTLMAEWHCALFTQWGKLLGMVADEDMTAEAVMDETIPKLREAAMCAFQHGRDHFRKKHGKGNPWSSETGT